MLDENGRLVAKAGKNGYDAFVSARESYAPQKFFIETRDNNDMHLAINSRDFTGVDGVTRPVIMFTRKVLKIDGSFGGIIGAALEPQYFGEFFKSINTGKKSYMTVALTNGTVLGAAGGDVQIGKYLVEHILSEYRDNGTNVSNTQMITMDTSVKIYSYRFMEHMPALVAVMIDSEDYLETWSVDTWMKTLFLLIFAISSSAFSFFMLHMWRQIRRVEESEMTAVLASQAKSEFLANMSHELRTPLNAIIGFSEMMDSGYFGNLTAKQKERIHDINLCGNHLLQLINDILEFSKGEAGKLELQEEEVRVAEIINECNRMMHEKSRANGVTIEVDADRTLPLILADKRKLRQILLNLLSNAIKFTPRGGVVQVIAKQDATRAIVIAVQDNGIGIPEEDIPKALSVFGQVHRSMSHEGTGLGLPLCRMFAELHGGKLALESKVGVGTRVSVILPASRILRGESAPAVSTVTKPSAKSSVA